MFDAIYDAIVVGAGPGGSTAAAFLAQSKLRILLINRESFPREKPCGDAVPGVCFDIMREIGLHGPYDPDDFYAIEQFLVRAPRGTNGTFKFSPDQGAGSCVVSRYVFDKMLCDQAIKNGAEFCLANVTGPLVENGQVVGVRLKSGRQEMECRSKMVIAADGATSAIARGLGSPPLEGPFKAVALRGYINTVVDLDRTIEINFMNSIQPGYGWFFPMGKRRANIGVGIRADKYRQKDMALPKILDIYMKSPGIHSLIGNNRVEDLRSWQLPLFKSNHRRIYNGALLTGDAGGFVNPLTGAGIFQAMVTGKFAAQTAIQAIRANDVSEAGLAAYDKAWRKVLAGEMSMANLVQRLIGIVPTIADLVLLTNRAMPGLTRQLIGKI